MTAEEFGIQNSDEEPAPPLATRNSEF